MKYFKNLAALIGGITLLVVCSKNPYRSQNSPPEIITVTAEPAQVYANQTTTLTVVVNDVDSQELQFTWSSEHGSFLSGNKSQSVNWQAPGSVGFYDCQVVVSDGQSEMEGKITVIVPPEGMVYVLEREFMMGTNDGAPDENPPHRVFLNGFYIEKYEAMPMIIHVVRQQGNTVSCAAARFILFPMLCNVPNALATVRIICAALMGFGA